VELEANSTFFLEYLKGYSTNSTFFMEYHMLHELHGGAAPWWSSWSGA
jgi:hypothetical protein